MEKGKKTGETAKETTKETRINGTPESGKRVTSKQVAAIIGVALLILMYIGALVAAVIDKSASGRLFRVCLYATAIIPILIWIYTWMYGKLTQKHTFADFDSGVHAAPDSKDRKSVV